MEQNKNQNTYIDTYLPDIVTYLQDHRGIASSLLLALSYTAATSWAFGHYLNFFPSYPWARISMILPLILAWIMFIPYLLKRTITSFDGLKIAFIEVMAVSFLSLLAYTPLAYGLGPAVNALFYTTVEKDITGSKVSGGTRHSYFYINTADLPEGYYAELYITRDEFKSLPQGEVCMHVTLKQSFFGMSVKRYTFLHAPKYFKGQVIC